MQAPTSPANQYLANKVMTASPQELTLMLYDGAIKFCNRAIINIDNNDIEETHKSLVKVQNIIEEFMIVVDRKMEIGNNLFLLYDYMYRRLVEANIRKDKAIVEEVQGLIRELRESWKIAMDKDKGIYVEPTANTINESNNDNNIAANEQNKTNEVVNKEEKVETKEQSENVTSNNVTSDETNSQSAS